MNNNIIYALKDPRTDEYKYVGKSVNGISRAKTHLIHSHNPLVNQWVSELKMDNYIPDIIILEHVSNWTELVDKEKYWVGKLLNEEHDLFNILIRDNYIDSINTYNTLLKERVKNREQTLIEKLNNTLMQFGNETDIAKLIKQRRKNLKITQDKLAEISGVGKATLKRIELNKSNTTIDTLIKILDVLGFEIFINLKSKN